MACAHPAPVRPHLVLGWSGAQSDLGLGTRAPRRENGRSLVHVHGPRGRRPTGPMSRPSWLFSLRSASRSPRTGRRPQLGVACFDAGVVDAPPGVLAAAVDEPPVGGADAGDEVEPHAPVGSVAADDGGGRLIDVGVADIQQPETVGGGALASDWVPTVP